MNRGDSILQLVLDNPDLDYKVSNRAPGAMEFSIISMSRDIKRVVFIACNDFRLYYHIDDETLEITNFDKRLFNVDSSYTLDEYKVDSILKYGSWQVPLKIEQLLIEEIANFRNPSGIIMSNITSVGRSLVKHIKNTPRNENGKVWRPMPSHIKTSKFIQTYHNMELLKSRPLYVEDKQDVSYLINFRDNYEFTFKRFTKNNPMTDALPESVFRVQTK